MQEGKRIYMQESRNILPGTLEMFTKVMFTGREVEMFTVERFTVETFTSWKADSSQVYFTFFLFQEKDVTHSS